HPLEGRPRPHFLGGVLLDDSGKQCREKAEAWFKRMQWVCRIAQRLLAYRSFLPQNPLSPILVGRVDTAAANPGKCPIGGPFGALGKISAPDRSLDRIDGAPDHVEGSGSVELADHGRLGEMMIGVHDHLKTARRLYSLAVHRLPYRIDIDCAGLADGLRPHPKADEGRLHRIVCGLV